MQRQAVVGRSRFYLGLVQAGETTSYSFCFPLTFVMQITIYYTTS